MKDILVISGSGKETSRLLLKNYLFFIRQRNGEKADVNVVDIKDFDEDIIKSDIVVNTMYLDNEKYTVPIFSGLPFLTGIRLNEEVDKIVCAL